MSINRKLSQGQTMSDSPSLSHRVVLSAQEWIAARRELHTQEKALTRSQDRVVAARRALPWLKIQKQYSFDTPTGQVSLADLFDGRSQLIVKHFMWTSESEICVGCSFEMDHIEGALKHLP